jgi:DNA-directed RNA polymerase subunit A'
MSSSLLVAKRPIKGRNILIKEIKKPETSSEGFKEEEKEEINDFSSEIEDSSERSFLLNLNKKFSGLTGGVSSSSKVDEVTMPINSLQFSMLTPKDIKGISVLEVTNFLMEGPNSIHDPRLGPIGNGRDNRCITCNGVYKRGNGDPNEIECPGHWSYIDLMVPIPHPLCTKEILTYLRLFCNIEGCGRLLFTTDQIKLLNLPKNLAARLTKLSEFREQLKVCGHCEKNQPVITAEDNKFYVKYKENEQPLNYERISNIFENIVPDDLQILGVDPELTHPSYFLIKCLPVLPPCVRNFVVSGDGNIGHDDLSYKYTDIVKLNNELKKSSSETRTEELLNLMSNTIHYMMDNSKGKAKDNSGHRPIRCLKQRLEGKHGHVRSTQGKRVDYCGRTVITGEANCDVDELYVPLKFAEKLTIPVPVNGINIKECQEMLDNGEVVFIIRGKRRTNAKLALFTKSTSFGNCDILIRQNKEGEEIRFTYDDVMDLEKTKGFTFLPTDEIERPNGKREVYTPAVRIPFRLQIGDVVERKIRDGDSVLFNRQPTLWKGSMRSKRIKLREGDTLRFNVSSTQPFNADYDKMSLS